MQIEKVGRGDSVRFTVELYVDDADEPYDTVRIGALEPGTSAYVEFSWL